jgi:transcriptional regulator with XRE-family HTH domain
LRDAYGLLERLQTAVENSATGLKGKQFCGFTIVWEESLKLAGNPIVDDLRSSLKNLAGRARTTPEDLIERMELIPVISEETSIAIDPMVIDDHENAIINSIDAKQKVNLMKRDLNQNEYELLLDRFVEGWTVRELEEKIGIKASTTVIRTKKIVTRLNKKSDIRTKRRISTKEANSTDQIGKIKKILTASEYELIERFAIKGETIEELSNDLGIAHEAILKELQGIKDKLVEMGIGEGYENTSNTAEAAA